MPSKEDNWIIRNIMTEFLLAGYPWIGMGLVIAIAITYLDARMKKNKKKSK